MIRLLLLLALAAAIWLFLNWLFRRLMGPPAGARRSGPAARGTGSADRLVRCEACGTYVPASRALSAGGGRRACSEPCRTALRRGS